MTSVYVSRTWRRRLKVSGEGAELENLVVASSSMASDNTVGHARVAPRCLFATSHPPSKRWWCHNLVVNALVIVHHAALLVRCIACHHNQVRHKVVVAYVAVACCNVAVHFMQHTCGGMFAAATGILRWYRSSLYIAYV